MIDLHWGQSKIYRELFVERSALFEVVCCSRGWGKSYLAATAAATAVFELLELPTHVPNKVVYIIAPTYDQVTDIYYPLLNYDLGLEHYAVASSRDLGRFIFERNVELRLLSYEAIERMRGKGAYLVVWDEVSSCYKRITAKEAWEGIIQPAIKTRWGAERAEIYGARSPGRGLLISTPKGYNNFYDFYNFRDLDAEWRSHHFDYTKSPLLNPKEIEKLKANMDPIEFASEYGASFADSGNNVFYCFDREKHVQRDVPEFVPPVFNLDGSVRQHGEDVFACIDFNVGIMAASFFGDRGGQMHFLHEMKGMPDTENLAININTKFKGHKVYAYPDPSGNARKTSAAVGVTDFAILEGAGIKVIAHSSAPPIIDSVKAVNKKLMTASGHQDIFIHPRCQGLITSLERTQWLDKNPDTATLDKSAGIEHFSDGVRYATEYRYPIKRGNIVVVRSERF